MIRLKRRCFFITIPALFLSFAAPAVGATGIDDGWDTFYQEEKQPLEKAEDISLSGIWEGTYITTGWKLGTMSVTVRREGEEYVAEVRMTNPEGNSITPVPRASGKMIGKEFAVKGATPAGVTDVKWSSIDIAMSGEMEGDVWSGALTRKTVIESRLEINTLSGLFRLERSRAASSSAGAPSKSGAIGGGGR